MFDQYELSKWDKVRCRLQMDMPFTMGMLHRRPIIWTQVIDRFAVDQAGNYLVNPQYFEQITIAQACFCFSHESMHLMLNHLSPARMQGRVQQRWNWACDAPINETLIGAGFEPVENIVRMPGAEDMSAEDIYGQMPEPEESEDGSGGGGDGDGDGSSGGGQQPPEGGQGQADPDLLEGDWSDPENPKPMNPKEMKEAAEKVAGDVVSAAQEAKAAGNMPGAMQRMVNELIQVRTPWYDTLEEYMLSRAKSDYSWARPNRRFIHSNLYLPSAHSPAMGEIVVGVDTSGSIGQTLLNIFSGHFNAILERAKPERVTVLYCDYDIAHVEEYGPDDLPVSLQPHGGGGTRFSPVFEYVKAKGITPDCLIYLTDGWCYEEIPEQEFPVVWLTVGRHKDLGPGKVIRYTDHH